MALAPVVRKVAQAYRFGLYATFRCRADRLWLRGLSRVFGFDPWHASAPFFCRPYKAHVVELANSVRPATVVEVGCGLGEILVRVRARNRLGFDQDASVIRAARFLHPWRARWVNSDGAAIVRVLPAGGTIDCLIMVNWIHNLSPAQLAELVLPLLPLSRHLLLDAIDADGPKSYRYKHDFAFLEGRVERVSAVREVAEQRSFVLFRVLQ
ncbi:MAG: class I SAM-dependent methyltransferase [Gammaproteobacteria bacterium]